MRKKMIQTSIILLLLTVVYIILVKSYDVAGIGPDGSEVGFSSFNSWFHTSFGMNDTWYKISKYLGYIPFIFVGFYGLIGLIQLIKRKSLLKVDKRLLVLGCFYIVLGLVYVLFEKVIINYRPVLMDGELEASFPSSHTMLALCISLTSLKISKYYLSNEFVQKLLNIGTWALMLLIVISRALSGVHWITDIFGGVLISLLLVSLYSAVLEE